jgi:hypothetical protein
MRGVRIERQQPHARAPRQALGECTDRRGDDRRVGRERGRQRVRVCFRNLRRKEQDVGALGGEQVRQPFLRIRAVNRQRHIGRLRDRRRRGAQDPKRHRQCARPRIFRACRDDVQSLFRREVAERDHTSHCRHWRRRSLRMRPYVDGQRRQIAAHPRRDVLRRCDHALRAAQELAQHGAPRADVEVPLRGPAGNAGRATRGVRLAAIAPALVGEMVLRADREVVVQRAVVGDAGVLRELEDRPRQAVHVMEVKPRDTDVAQRVGKRRQIAGQPEPGGERLALPRPMQLDGVRVRGLEIKHVRALPDERGQLVHVPANAAAPRVRHEHDGRAR